MSDPQPPGIPQVLAAGLFGAAICGLGMFVGAGSTAVFQRNPYLVIWLFLVVAQGALYGVLPFLLFQQLNGLIPELGRRRFETAVVVVCVVAFVAAVPIATSQLLGIDPPLPHHRTKWLALDVLGVCLTALPAALGIYAVQCAARRAGSAPGDETAVHRYLDLRSRASIFLTVLGSMVALATLTAGASRRAIAPELPPEIIVAYGGHFTLLVALIYAPAHFELRRLGQRLLAGAPASAPSRSDLASRMNVDLKETLQTSIPVFAPLLSGLLALAFR